LAGLSTLEDHRLTKSDTDGEVVFATASMLKHQVFNSPPNMNVRISDFAISIQYGQEPESGFKAAMLSGKTL
jgi:hypothetical protein